MTQDARPRHAVLATYGSSGDVHPFLGLGLRLRQRGWRVTLVTNPKYDTLARQHGLDFHGVGDEGVFDSFVNNPDIWHPRRAAKVIFSAMAGATRETHAALVDCAADADLVLASTLAVGARVFQETHDRPTVTMHLAPTALRSRLEPTVLPGLPPLQMLPKSVLPIVLKHFWNGADRFVLDPLLGGINDFRQELGLTPVTGLTDAWWNSPTRILGAWPSWFGQDPGDWPAQLRLTGFPQYDERETADLPADVAAFLDEGDPPIAFTPGSAMKFGQRFFATAAEACRRLEIRGLLLTRHAEQIPPNLPAGVRHVAFAPFSQLLPRCRAIVHHGGIGTMAQGFAAGLPQLIMPMAHDQLDNAFRLRRLGCGDSLKPRQFTPRRVTNRLGHLLSNDTVAAACRTYAGRLQTDDGLDVACDKLERVANQTPSAAA